MRETLVLRRPSDDGVVLCLFNFSDTDQDLLIPAEQGRWAPLLDTESNQYGGAGSQVPGQFESNGEIRLAIRKSSGLILHHSFDAETESPTHFDRTGQ